MQTILDSQHVYPCLYSVSFRFKKQHFSFCSGKDNQLFACVL